MNILMMDESASGEKTRGGPPPFESKTSPEQFFCPVCTGRIDDMPLYGLTFGGMGSYWSCDLCGWFYKIMDEDSEVPR